MKIQQIRSASIRVTYGGTAFLVDPWLAPKESMPPVPRSPHPDRRMPLVDLPMPVEEIIKADAVIVTHMHFDHFDQTAADALPKDRPIFAQDTVDAALLGGYGFSDVRLLQADGSEFGGVTLYRTGCVHGVREKTEPVYAALGARWETSGVVFACPGEKTVYVAGDTIWCDAVADAVERFRPDIVVVNAADAQTDPTGSILMGLDDLGKMIESTPDTTKIIASHLDSVGHATIGREDIRRFAEQHSLQGRLLVPEDGEIMEF